MLLKVLKESISLGTVRMDLKIVFSDEDGELSAVLRTNGVYRTLLTVEEGAGKTEALSRGAVVFLRIAEVRDRSTKMSFQARYVFRGQRDAFKKRSVATFTAATTLERHLR